MPSCHCCHRMPNHFEGKKILPFDMTFLLLPAWAWKENLELLQTFCGHRGRNMVTIEDNDRKSGWWHSKGALCILGKFVFTSLIPDTVSFSVS